MRAECVCKLWRWPGTQHCVRDAVGTTAVKSLSLLVTVFSGAGVELMAGRWAQAVKGVLRSHGSESPKIEAARKLYWDTNDPAAAAKAMPQHMHAEHACLEVCSTNA